MRPVPSSRQDLRGAQPQTCSPMRRRPFSQLAPPRACQPGAKRRERSATAAEDADADDDDDDDGPGQQQRHRAQGAEGPSGEEKPQAQQTAGEPARVPREMEAAHQEELYSLPVGGTQTRGMYLITFISLASLVWPGARPFSRAFR